MHLLYSNYLKILFFHFDLSRSLKEKVTSKLVGKHTVLNLNECSKYYMENSFSKILIGTPRVNGVSFVHSSSLLFSEG